MNRTGTVKSLIGSFAFNGRELNAVEFGILANVLGEKFAKNVGQAERPAGQRGKPATIWQLASKSPVKITELPAPADAAPAEGEVVAQNDESANGVPDTAL